MNNIARLGIILLISLSACRVGPRYEPPCTYAPDEWKNEQPEPVETPYADFWWEVFNDDTLNELESFAVEYNPSLYIALQRICEARALAGIEAANLFPQLTINPAYTDVGMLFQANLPGNLPLPTGLTNIPPFRVHQMQYLLPLNLNYELDLWGKLRDRFDSAFYNMEAAEEAYCSLMLTLTADLASAYYQLRALDAEVALLKSNIETRKKNYDLTQSRYNKGLVTYLDVTQAEVDLANVEAGYHDSVRLRTLAENQIAVLAGLPASDFCLEPLPLDGTPPVIPAGLPSTVLMRRPDIAEAERHMASEHALIGAAYASFFPTLSLTGALGYSSPDLSHFTKWISRYWQLGANSSQMVFDGGRDCSNLQLAWARFGEASGAYQQQVLTAFREVEDALNNLEQQAKQAEQLHRAANAAKKATELSLSRYRQGVAIYLEVVENERLYLQTEVNWVNLQGALYISTIQLIKALGGGWDGCSFEAFAE